MIVRGIGAELFYCPLTSCSQGSYSSNTESKPVYEKAFQTEEAPSGMLVRGKYNAASSFVDDDNITHLTFNWSFEIKKEW
jgi:Rho GDP-dissociation inhibitor